MSTSEPFLPFSRPSIGDDEIDAVVAVLRSGWLTTGEVTRRFEEAFAAYCGADHAVAVASGTAGMHLVFSALGIGPGDEVITPSLTWVSTANLIALSGATPVFVDVDPDTLMVTPQAVAAAITARTRAIVPVHYIGAPCDLDSLRAIAAEHGIALIEDAAHAAGTRYRDRPIGAGGTAVFSFHPNKNVTAGEGGLVATGDAALAERIYRLRFHGLGTAAADTAGRGRSPRAEVVEPGYKYNLTDIAAALGLSQLGRLDGFNARRRALADRYLEAFAGIDGIEPVAAPRWPHLHARHLMVVRVEPDRFGLNRDALMTALAERGIGSGIHFRAVHTQQYYREHGYAAQPLPVTECNSERICSLPLFPDMRDSDADRVIAAIRTVRP